MGIPDIPQQGLGGPSDLPQLIGNMLASFMLSGQAIAIQQPNSHLAAIQQQLAYNQIVQQAILYQLQQQALACATQTLPVTHRHIEDEAKRQIMPRIPDTANCIIGWRIWSVQDGKLGSYSLSSLWDPRIPMKARCVHNPNSSYIPSGSCSCGIYACSDPKDLHIAENYPIGRVALWGRVLKYSHGYKAEYAYPVNLYLVRPYPWLYRVFRWRSVVYSTLHSYGVPVEIVSRKQMHRIMEGGNNEHRGV